MIQGYIASEGRLRRAEEPLTEPGVAWLDLANPMPHHRAEVEQALGIELPSREQMEEIEESSRLYVLDGTIYMTVPMPVQTELDLPLLVPVSFILTERQLVTIHDYEPRAFKTFPQRAEKIAMGCFDGESVLMGLLDAIVDRLADVLEAVGRQIEQLTRNVLHARHGPSEPPKDYGDVLRDIGHQGEIVSNVLRSLVSIERLLVFIGPAMAGRLVLKETRTRIKSLTRDTHFLSEHCNFLAQKISFLLDATLGMIGIEQNATIKIFSVAAVVFLPPTLIASIYGMNFADMPELDWRFGYPMGLAMMVASALGSYWVFKRKGWL